MDSLLNAKNDCYMRRVWSALNKRTDDEGGTAMWLYWRCARAYDWRERKTHAEKRRDLLAISRKAKDLSELLGSTGRRAARTRAEMKVVLAEMMEADYRGYQRRNETAERIAAKAVESVLYEHNNPFDEEVLPESEYAPFGYPALHEMLLKLSDDLAAEAEVPPVTGKPNADTAHAIVFARRLTADMRDRFGQPLRVVVANTASVIFDIEVSEEFVRNNTR